MARAPSPSWEHAPAVPRCGPESPISVQKRPSNCTNFVGAVGLEPTNPSLVRRNTVRNTPSSPDRLTHLSCENHARRCPRVPGRVCTVVPASGSRGSLLTPRLRSEFRAWRQAYRSLIRRMAGTPVRAALDRWTGRWGPAELGTRPAPRPGRERVPGSQHPYILRTREQLSRLTSRADGRPTPREHRPSRGVTGSMKNSADQVHTK